MEHHSQKLGDLSNIPIEIRHEIYATLFKSRELTYPDLQCPPLLLTSRSVYEDALPFYYGHTVFNLLTTEHFLDYLASIPPSTLKRLRHIKLRAFPFGLRLGPENDIRFFEFQFSHVLPLFPGLQLSTLTLEDAFHGEDIVNDGWGDQTTYKEVVKLLQGGRGFKKLIHRSRSKMYRSLVSSSILYPEHSSSDGIVFQPSTWTTNLLERDGIHSGAKAEIWTTENGQDWFQVHKDYLLMKRENKDWSTGDGSHGSKFAIELTAIRGRDADIEQNGDHGSYADLLHQIWQKMGWKEMKQRGIFRTDDPESDFWDLL